MQRDSNGLNFNITPGLLEVFVGLGLSEIGEFRFRECHAHQKQHDL